MQNEKEVKRFIKYILPKITENMELRALPSRKQLFRHSQELYTFINEHASENIYFGVCSRTGGDGSKSAVCECPALWVDLDFKDFPGGQGEADEKVKSFQFLPTIMVNSGHGYHIYWFFKEAEDVRDDARKDHIERILKGLAKQLNGDMASAEIARILRVPGTINWKGKGKPVEVTIQEWTEHEYNLLDFEDYAVEDTNGEPKKADRQTVEEINEKCAFLRHAYQNPNLQEPLWYAMISNLCRLSPGGPSLCHEYSKGYPNYNKKETDGKILHSLDDTGPYTCRWIREQGFICGKECAVRSPIVMIQKDKRTGARDVEEGPVRLVDDLHIITETEFPFNIFPTRFLRIVNNISEAHHVEREITASSMICIFSGAIGNTIKVSPKAGYVVNLPVWLINVMATGYGKSPLLKTLSSPIERLQGDEYQRYSTTLKQYDKCLRDTKKGNDVELPDKPKMKHFFVSDATVESLGSVFEDDPRGVIIQQDEISGLIFGLNQYKGKGNDRQHYLELFNAGSWKIDRKSGTKFIHNTGAAIIGGIQTGVMPRVFGEDAFEDGLLPRFLLLCADSKPNKFSRKGVESGITKAWETILKRAYAIPLVVGDDGFVKPQVLLFAEDALNAWIPFYDEYNEILPYLSDRAKVFIPKLTSYHSLKFAGILHCLKAINTPSGEISQLIDIDTIRGAIALTQFFAGQAIKALRLYEPEEDRLNSFQKRVIETLYQLRGHVRKGYLAISTIAETYNQGLRESVQHDRKQVGALLRGLGLKTEKKTDNLSFLLWEEPGIEKLFSKVIAVENNYQNYPNYPNSQGTELEEEIPRFERTVL